MEMMQCPLCGHRFERSAGQCGPACPLKSACSFICCPRCGYQIVDATRAASVNWLLRLWRRNVPPEKTG